MAIFRPIIAGSQSTVNDEEVREQLKDLELALRNHALNNARAILSTILGHLRNAARPHNISLLNTITSVEEGLASAEIGPMKARKELAEAFAEYSQSITKALDSLVIPTQKDEKVAFDQVLDRSTEVLLSFASQQEAILKRIREQGIVLTTAPVLTISSPPLDVSKLKSNGFKAKSLSGYAVLEDQLVVGISVDVVLSRTTRKLSKDGSKKPSTPEERNQIKEEFLDTVLQKYRNRKMIAVGGENSYEKSSWFWLVPSDNLRLLRSCTIVDHTVSSVNFTKWGFPFRGAQQ